MRFSFNSNAEHLFLNSSLFIIHFSLISYVWWNLCKNKRCYTQLLGQINIVVYFTKFICYNKLNKIFEVNQLNSKSQNETLFWKKKEYVSFVLSILVLFIHSYFAPTVLNDSFISLFNHKFSFFFSRSITRYAVPALGNFHFILLYFKIFRS